MKYVLLIQQGETPTPDSPEAWARLSEEEQQAVYADCQAINQTHGVTAEEAAQEAFAIAAERWPKQGPARQPARLARDDRAQPRDRPHPPRSDAGGEDPPSRGR